MAYDYTSTASRRAPAPHGTATASEPLPSSAEGVAKSSTDRGEARKRADGTHPSPSPSAEPRAPSERPAPVELRLRDRADRDATDVPTGRSPVEAGRRAGGVRPRRSSSAVSPSVGGGVAKAAGRSADETRERVGRHADGMQSSLSPSTAAVRLLQSGAAMTAVPAGCPFGGGEPGDGVRPWLRPSAVAVELRVRGGAGWGVTDVPTGRFAGEAGERAAGVRPWLSLGAAAVRPLSSSAEGVAKSSTGCSPGEKGRRADGVRPWPLGCVGGDVMELPGGRPPGGKAGRVGERASSVRPRLAPSAMTGVLGGRPPGSVVERAVEHAPGVRPWLSPGAVAVGLRAGGQGVTGPTVRAFADLSPNAVADGLLLATEGPTGVPGGRPPGRKTKREREHALGMRPWLAPSGVSSRPRRVDERAGGRHARPASAGDPRARSARCGSTAPPGRWPAGAGCLRSRTATDKLQSASCGDKMEDAIPPVRDRAGPSQEWC